MRGLIYILPLALGIALSAHAEPCTEAESEPSLDALIGAVAAAPATEHCDEWGSPIEMGRIRSDKLTEISGMAVSIKNPGVIWLHNDSHPNDDRNYIYAINRDGKKIAEIKLKGIKNVDWEDMAIGPCGDYTCIYIADTGDNKERRNDIKVLRIFEPEIDADTDPDDDIELKIDKEDIDVYPIVYGDGPRDAEAMVVTPDEEIVLFTKRTDGTAKVYRVSGLDEDREYWDAEKLGKLKTANGREGTRAWATAADLTPDGERLFVRSHQYMYEFDLTQTDEKLSDPKELEGRKIPVKRERQGESVAFDPHLNGYWHISEGARAKLYFVPCADETDEDES